jgi:hypothetical protein
MFIFLLVFNSKIVLWFVKEALYLLHIHSKIFQKSNPFFDLDDTLINTDNMCDSQLKAIKLAQISTIPTLYAIQNKTRFSSNILKPNH